MPRPSARVVALVGARRASPGGLEIARRLAGAAAAADLWVVSGGAIGIDGAAHAGALDAGGRTLAVLGTPLTDPGPRLNRPLFDRMLEWGGGWLSEQNGPPDRLAFCRRNRLIAALADLVVVVEGAEKSGTRYTLQAAHRLGRNLGAVTWSPGDRRGAQAEWVFRNGGSPITSPEALLKRCGRRRRRREGHPDPASGSLGASALQASSGSPNGSAEALAVELGISIQEALVRLTELELEGRIRSDGGGRFSPSE